MNFNKELFLENAKERRLTSGEALIFDGLNQADVRNVIDLDGTYEYKVNGTGSIRRIRHLFKNTDDDKVILQRALDVIYDNIVGQILLKLLTVKHGLSGRKIGLVNYPGNGSCYDETIEAVFVNLSLYQHDGSGIPTRQYYSVDPGGKIVLKRKSLEQSIFHELTHGLHYISDGKYADTALCLQDSVMKEIWSDDEELRTITGHMIEKPYDPVCDHVFDYSLNGNQFCPRYGHVGWCAEAEYEQDVVEMQLGLERNLTSQIRYMNGWKRYQLPDSLPPLASPPTSRKAQSKVSKHRPLGGAPTLPHKPTIIKPHVMRNPIKL
jgi:hypothetical protein